MAAGSLRLLLGVEYEGAFAPDFVPIDDLELIILEDPGSSEEVLGVDLSVVFEFDHLPGSLDEILVFVLFFLLLGGRGPGQVTGG